MRYDIIETVWNSYKLSGYPDNIEELLHEKYDGNAWLMQEDYPNLKIELSEACFEFIESDYGNSELS
jgi:hypothetical protein